MGAAGSCPTKITLPSDRELAMTRTFDAPRSMVFDAWTKPELLKRWFGPPEWSLTACEIDLRVGGAWRFVMRGPRREEMTLRGVYLEIAVGERLVNTQLMEGCEGQGDAEALCTLVLVERDGRTTMTSTTRYPSKEVRDAVLKHGASEEGMERVYGRLATLLASAASGRAGRVG